MFRSVAASFARSYHVALQLALADVAHNSFPNITKYLTQMCAPAAHQERGAHHYVR